MNLVLERRLTLFHSVNLHALLENPVFSATSAYTHACSLYRIDGNTHGLKVIQPQCILFQQNLDESVSSFRGEEIHTTFSVYDA